MTAKNKSRWNFFMNPFEQAPFEKMKGTKTPKQIEDIIKATNMAQPKIPSEAELRAFLLDGKKEPVAVFEAPIPVMTAEQIHATLDQNAATLLQEAKDLIAGTSNSDKGKFVDQLKKLGFTSFQEAEALTQFNEQKAIAEKAIYYHQHYPMNKFITFAVMDHICTNCKLVYAEPSKFIGSIPLKNQEEIVNFKLNAQDVEESTFGIYRQIQNAIQRHEQEINAWAGLNQQPRETIRYNQNTNQLEYQQHPQVYYGGVDPWLDLTKPVPSQAVAPEYLMMAPKEMFKLSTYDKVIGNTIVNTDPIVLARVKMGFLVVSRWGEEVNIKELDNPKAN